jgi:hypothetical protein
MYCLVDSASNLQCKFFLRCVSIIVCAQWFNFYSWFFFGSGSGEVRKLSAILNFFEVRLVIVACSPFFFLSLWVVNYNHVFS